ncbi:MAG: hypothetical protein D6726_03265 [Nitrospirae bacterium]|nr:MAG: hypothetical protein D6726_03265 [Nitrospirota bacterium]
MSGLYLARGKIRVTASGYWFTAGGEKGSFGYYPHLKDMNGYPVYPDTQLHGNLMMALDWLSDLKQAVPGSEEVTSKVFVTDLCLSDRSEWKHDRYQVKPRIKINEKRTVAEHMLGFLEMAYLEGLELQAEIFAGYMKTVEELQTLKRYLSEAVLLLNSMGAFRSRGFGRGNFTLSWGEDIVITPLESSHGVEECFYTLTNLTNFRNKPIEPGSYQNIRTLTKITPEQLRGWLVRVYHDLYDEWPGEEDLSKLRISSLYPCLTEADRLVPSFPASISTLREDGGKIVDMAGRTYSGDEEQASSMVRAKRKTLPENCYVTNELPFRVFRAPVNTRIRNHLDDSFVSREKGGLFAQEFIPAGTRFGGTINFITDADPLFMKKVTYILRNVHPLIKGTIFEPSLEDRSVKPDEDGEGLYLLTEPLPYSETLFKEGEWKQERGRGGRLTAWREGVSLLNIGTIRRYNTTLERPRRPRIVCEAGSVLTEPVKMKTLAWKGFGAEGVLHDVRGLPAPGRVSHEAKADPVALQLARSLSGISKSHTGFLRNFLNRNIPLPTLREWAKDRLDKFEKKERKELKDLYDTIIKKMDEDTDGDAMRNFIHDLIEQIRLERWKSELREGKEEAGERV